MNAEPADIAGKFTITTVVKDVTKKWVKITEAGNLSVIVVPDMFRQITYNFWNRNMVDQNWLSKLTLKAMRICRLNKRAAGNHRQDMTGPVLENLMGEGYNQVMWNSNASHHGQCRDLNRQTWALDDFLRTSEYDAPLFSRSHPGDNSCTLTVSGPGLPPVEVDSYGETDQAIGTNRPPAPTPVQKVPAPVTEQPIKVPTIKPLAPAEPTVERVPEKPEQKIRQVPKEVHKQIKDPFEKQDQTDNMTDQEYLDWLKELEKEPIPEPVDESIPAQPKYTDEEVEEWNRSMNRETSKKVPNWITGLFKG